MQEFVQTWQGFESKVKELTDLRDLADEEGDSSLEEAIHSEIGHLTSYLNREEIQLLFSDEHDKGNVLLAIHAGAGGTESQDWADMLLRMYLRWAERSGHHAEMVDLTPGEEAGIKSAMLEIKGKYSYGYLRSEHGVHRLVRLSPFDADHARHTSFALVEVLPEGEETVEVGIGPDDLKIDTFRSSGPGGQHMQKSSTAVRITHLPTGLVVSCQNQRSQLQNKEAALKILRARLLERELRLKAEERLKIKGEHLSAAWGNQIRSYVLHPYKLVKDHRTGQETSNVTAVLDGELEELMQTYLKSRVGKEE